MYPKNLIKKIGRKVMLKHGEAADAGREIKNNGMKQFLNRLVISLISIIVIMVGGFWALTRGMITTNCNDIKEVKERIVQIEKYISAQDQINKQNDKIQEQQTDILKALNELKVQVGALEK